MADAKLTALTAASALAAADLFYVSQSAASRKATGTQLLALVGTAYVPLAGGASMAGPLTIASGTLTASAPALSITQTWNNAAVAFNAFDISITSTDSSISSTLQRWILGGAEKASISKDGIGYFRGGASAGAAPTQDTTINVYNFGIRMIDVASLQWTSGGSGAGVTLALYQDAAAQLALRNGTTAQRMHIYGTSDGTPGANYQRLVLSANGTTGVTIAAEGLGTPGANQNITLTPGGTGTVLHPLGTYGAPGIGFVGYPNTGIYTTDGTSMGFSFGSAVGVLMSTTRLGLAVGVLLGWNQGTAGQYADDIALARNAAGVVEVNNGTAGTWRDLKLRNLIQTEYNQLTEMTAPSAPATNSVRIYAEDNGSGKTRLMALFASGVAQQIAIEP